jgi:hypothetical protein
MKPMLRKIIATLFFLLTICGLGQSLQEVHPPYNIKTISFQQNNENVIPIFRLGDFFKFSFDDLFMEEANYYYTITHCNYDWTKSQLSQIEYLNGLDNQRIINYENSVNTLQNYSHYEINFPNQFTKGFLVTGNYVLTILNNYQEVIFSRKFVIYEDLVSVPMTVRRARVNKDIEFKHNLEFTISPRTMVLQNPIQNIRIVLLKNGIWNTAIRNVKPMFTLGTDLVYRYDKETQFWAGNEFLAFDSKDIRVAMNGIRGIDGSSSIYNTYLYTNEARQNKIYTFNPDTNGNFVVRNVNTLSNDAIEADYSWVYFSLSAPSNFSKKDIYVSGLFNNYALTPEYKMEYNPEKRIYEKAIIIKQGFTSYEYTLADSYGKVDFENAIDGNFFQTENDYFCIVYYRANNDRYDRVIGKGVANSFDNKQN